MKKVIITSIVVIMCVVVGLYAFVGMNVSSISISEAMQSDKYVQVKGKKKDIYYDNSSDQLRFTLIDEKGDEMSVIYNNIKPSTFDVASHVVVKGKYDRSNGYFIAEELMLKCPSKYKSELKKEKDV